MLSARHLFKAKPFSPQFISVFTSPSCRNLSGQKQDASFLEVEEQDESEMLKREAEIEEMRNKSGLFPDDYNRQHDRPPHPEPKTPYHETLAFKRKMYGKYGEASKVNPSILWPSKVELAAMKEWLEVAQPFTIQELLKRNEERKQREKEEREKEEAAVLLKVKRVPIEIIEFKRKVEQKRLKAEAEIEKKNQLIKEVKKHFDYPIDIRDEKFQIKLAELKEEEKKRAKAERKSKKIGKLKKMDKQQQEPKSEEGEDAPEKPE